MATATETHSTTWQEARSTANAYLEARLAAGQNTTNDGNFVIPIIDLSNSFSGRDEDKRAIAAQIRTACTTSGFFFITGHG
jgi:hypothetical protein